MKVILDTSSLLAFVRYYLPFDKDDSLKDFIRNKIDAGEIVVIDKVFEEARYLSKGIIVDKLDFLKEKIRHYKTEELLPSSKFFNILDNQLCYITQKNKLTAAEYELSRNKYLDSADAKLILFCLNDSSPLGIDNPVLVTEETSSENDNKLFKKLPAICEILHINHCNLPALFKNHYNLSLSQFLE